MNLGTKRWPVLRKLCFERGWTVLEIFLAVLLSAILASAFYTIHRRGKKESAVRQCAERQWIWTNALDLVETDLRQWEIKASPCLRAGFAPVQAESDGNAVVYELIEAKPIVDSMRMEQFVSVPKAHFFKPGDKVLLCSEFETNWAEIKRVHPGSDRVSSLELRTEEDSTMALFESGSVIATVQKVEIEQLAGDEPGTFTIYRREGEKRRRSWIRLVDVYSFEVKAGQEGIPSQFQWSLGYGDCSMDRTFQLTRMDSEVEMGQWFLGEKELFFDSYVSAMSESEGS